MFHNYSRRFITELATRATWSVRFSVNMHGVQGAFISRALHCLLCSRSADQQSEREGLRVSSGWDRARVGYGCANAKQEQEGWSAGGRNACSKKKRSRCFYKNIRVV